MSSNSDRYYRLLTRNMVLIVLLVSIAPLVITGVTIHTQFESAYYDKLEDHLSGLVTKHSQTIERYLNDRLSEIRVMARSYPVKQLNDPIFLRKKLGLLQEEFPRSFVDLGLVDEKGIQVAYAGPFNLAQADYSQANWFKAAMRSEDYISDVFAGLRGTPHFIVAVRRNCEGRDFILKATIDFEAFKAMVESIRIGNTGFAFILNDRGAFQTEPRFAVNLKQPPYQGLSKKLLGSTGISIVEATDAAGRPTIFAIAALKKGAWFLCFQQALSDAFRHLNRSKTITLVIFLASCLVIVLVAFLLSKRMVNRIIEADQQKEMVNQQKAAINEKYIESGRLASIGELAAGIAHEINNPVAIMVEEAGWIEDILAEDKPIDEEDLAEIQRAVQQIRTQGTRCKSITYKLLSFARKTDPKVDCISLNPLVEEVLSLVSQKARYANVTIQHNLDAAQPDVCAPTSEIQQVLLNLINNAIDAMEKTGGTMTVITGQENGQTVLEVSDTGEGIAEANLSRIFDPFYTTKPVGQGTGLGLSICYGIVTKLGGDIKVRSQKGVGTSFNVYLPQKIDVQEDISHGQEYSPARQDKGEGKEEETNGSH